MGGLACATRGEYPCPECMFVLLYVFSSSVVVIAFVVYILVLFDSIRNKPNSSTNLNDTSAKYLKKKSKKK